MNNQKIYLGYVSNQLEKGDLGYEEWVCTVAHNSDLILPRIKHYLKTCKISAEYLEPIPIGIHVWNINTGRSESWFDIYVEEGELICQELQ